MAGEFSDLGAETATGFARRVTPPRVRRFAMHDLASILRIEQKSFGVDAWPADLFKNYALRRPELFLVAQVGRRIAGYSITCVSARGVAEVDSIAVLPRYRGRGIAKMLLQRSIQKVRRIGVSAVTLMVRRENTSAIQLYRRLGFVRTATVKDYYEDGATAWRMRLALE